MLGIAMLTIVRSSKVMKKPRDRVIRIAHGFPCHLLSAEGMSNSREVTGAPDGTLGGPDDRTGSPPVGGS
jgi:hypothetical protein